MVSNKKETQSKKAAKKNNNKKVVKKTVTKKTGTKKTSARKTTSNNIIKNIKPSIIDNMVESMKDKKVHSMIDFMKGKASKVKEPKINFVKRKELEDLNNKVSSSESKTTFINSSELDFFNKNPQLFSKPISKENTDCNSRISFKAEDRKKLKDRESDHDKLFAKAIERREGSESSFDKKLESLDHKEEDPFTIVSKIESLVAKYTKESLEANRKLKMANLLLEESNKLLFESDLYEMMDVLNLNKFHDLNCLFKSLNKKVDASNNTKVNKLEETDIAEFRKTLEFIKQSQEALNESRRKFDEQQERTAELLRSIKANKAKK
jgi:hypothetical protein